MVVKVPMNRGRKICYESHIINKNMKNYTKIINTLIKVQVYLLFALGMIFILFLIGLPLLVIGILPMFIIPFIKVLLIISILCLLVMAAIGLIKSFIRKRINK